MAENFDFIENDVRPTRRKKMEKAKGQRKSVNKKKGNRRMSRRSRRATSKAKILYLQKKNNYNKNGATDNNGKTTLFEDESDRIEIYNVVLRTLWWAKNFRERFIGIDDPSRGRYKWQHNAPPGQEDMNIYIALKDVFLQCHDTASVLRKKEDNVLQSRKQWLQAVNKFLDALKYGFEGRLYDRKNDSSELCYFSLRRNKYYQYNDYVEDEEEEDDDENDVEIKKSYEDDNKSDISNNNADDDDKSNDVSKKSMSIKDEDELLHGNFEIAIAFLDRLENKQINNNNEKESNLRTIQLSTLKSVKMRDFPRGKQKLAQIRIKYGKHEKIDILVPFLDDRSANIPDALTPEIITNGFEMILSGASGYKKKIDEDTSNINNDESSVAKDDINNNITGSQLNFNDIYSTMSQVYTSRLNRAADVIFDILASLYSCHNQIENPKSIMRGLESLNTNHSVWWQPCVSTLAAKKLKPAKATLSSKRLKEKDSGFSTFTQELVVTWNEGTEYYVDTLSTGSPRRSQKRNQPAPFLPLGMISFWHDIDVVDVLDVCGIDNDKSMSSMKEFPQIIRDLLLWRAYCTDKQNATDVNREPRFHLLQRPGTFLIRLKWPGQVRAWPERIASLGSKSVWNMLNTDDFEIDLLQIFDSLGAKKKTRAVTRRAETAIYRLKQIICFSVTGHFYSFKSASETDSNQWHLITSNSNTVSSLEWDDICKLCVHRRAFPELLFYEDSAPSLFERMDSNRRKRLHQDHFSSIVDPNTPLVLPIMSLVPGKHDARDGVRIFNGSETEYADDADDDEYDEYGDEEERSILMNYVRHEQRRRLARAASENNNDNNEWCKCIVS